MNTEELKKLVDYYIANSGGDSSLIVSALAVLISLAAIGVSIYTFRKQHHESLYAYLASVWNDVLDDCMATPTYLDVTQTEHYYRLMSHDEALKYDVYCYKAWGHVEDIVEKGYENNEQFEPIIRWISAYHYTWLSRNPTFFVLEKFWEKVEEIREEPNLIYGYRRLPSKNGDIDWDIVSEDYHHYILGPFAPEMVSPDQTGRIRNKLIDYLNQIPAEDLSSLEIADFGCGPGNIIPFIARKITTITGVDISQGALDIAKSVAEINNIKFESVCTDILTLDENKKYDLIISVNSVLPKNRELVLALLIKMRACLKPSGKIVAILPSFDTTKYLKELWKEYYRKSTQNEKHVARIERAFIETKKMDDSQLSYSDDGHNSQCYHTEASIIKEFPESGLRLTMKPEKVYYPWELTRRFDYGYFPNAKEEIWDWFVVAERSELNIG